MSSSIKLFAFISIILLYQSLGIKAATVNSPNGGKLAFFDTNFKACLKLQNVSGYLGYTKRIFIYYFFNLSKFIYTAIRFAIDFKYAF